jgi:antitoxin component YwqK of YwqJK toxin-antitoxin module
MKQLAHRTACLALAALAALAAPSCLTQTLEQQPPGAEEKPAHVELRRQHNKETGKLVHEWSVLVRRGAKSVRTGADRTWYSSGTKQWEREFEQGEPRGTWRKWYENGRQQSETIFAGPDVETTMRFWHENGQLAAEGPAKNGERCGTWKFWREDGSLSEEGPYANSMREGPWTLHDVDGTTRSVNYVKNVRTVESPKH